MVKGSYHHGDLRRAILTAAGEAIAERGVAALSLRDVARRAGVSHAAPVHHFGDKTGVLTALATEGFDLLTATLTAEPSRNLTETGVAYVRFAVAHKGHFEVMFRPDLQHADDPELAAARQRAGDVLAEAVRTASDDRMARVAAWSLVHGFATLWLSGALPPDVTVDVEASAGAVAATLFPPAPG